MSKYDVIESISDYLDRTRGSRLTKREHENVYDDYKIYMPEEPSESDKQFFFNMMVKRLSDTNKTQ